MNAWQWITVVVCSVITGSVSFVLGAWWMVKHHDVRPLDVDEEEGERRSLDQKIADQLDHDSHPLRPASFPDFTVYPPDPAEYWPAGDRHEHGRSHAWQVDTERSDDVRQVFTCAAPNCPVQEVVVSTT